MPQLSEAVRQLNRLEEDWTADEDQLEADVRADVAMYSEVLHDRLEDKIERLAETPLSRREAVVHLLRKVMTEDGDRLSLDAIALAVTVEGSPFGREDDQEPLTSSDIRQIEDQVHAKVSEAKELIGEFTFPEREQVLDNPLITWLDTSTAERLRIRAQAGEATPDEVVTRLLSETVEPISLDDMVDAVHAEFDHVASITVRHFASHEDPGGLDIKVYTGEADGLEDYRSLLPLDHEVEITKADEAFTVPVSVIATTGGPVERDSPEATTIYMADNVHGSEPLALADGLAYLKDKLECPDMWSPEHRAAIAHIQGYAD